MQQEGKRKEVPPRNVLVVCAVIGFYCGIVLYAGIASHSVNVAQSIGLVLLVSIVPLLSSMLGAIAPLFWRIVNGLWLAGFVACLALGVERLVYLHADSYPRFLANEITTEPARFSVYGPYLDVCGPGRGLGVSPVEQKANGAFVRCGEFWSWSNTYYLKDYDAMVSLWLKKYQPEGTGNEQ